MLRRTTATDARVNVRIRVLQDEQRIGERSSPEVMRALLVLLLPLSSGLRLFNSGV